MTFVQAINSCFRNYAHSRNSGHPFRVLVPVPFLQAS